jgi:transmembrane sensor
MNKSAPNSDRLLDEAIDLIIRLQNDPNNPVAIDMIRAWRLRGPEHEKIWSSVSDARGMTGKILTDRRKAERREELGLTRRNFVIGGTLGLGAIAGGSYVIPDIIVRARADHITAKGEIRRQPLSDGSVATLGPDTAIAVDYRPDHRRIELLKGMSFFEVAKDARRVFLVQSGDFIVTALGTAFDLSSDAGMVMVSVEHGSVEIRASNVLASGQRLGAEEWFTYEPSSQAIDRGMREASQIAAWRDKMVVAEREPVSALVARIGRWLPGSIVVVDPFVGSQKVSGLFDLGNPLRALEAVVHPAGGRVRRVSSLLTLISPI